MIAMWLRIGLTCLVLGALSAALPAMAQQRIKVVATFSVLADMVANVGGELIELSVLVGPDADAHTYQPTPAEARVLAASQVLVLNGLGFEGWIDRLAHAAPFRGRRIVASEGVAPLTVKAGGHHHGHSHGTKPVQDPHCWQDLVCGQRYVANIGAGLAAADPPNAAAYRERAAAYAAKLAALDAWVRTQIGTVPTGKRRAITGHDSFGYFARAYAVEFRAPAGVNTQSEPSARDVANLIAQIRREGIRAVFMENMTNPVLIRQIARDAGAVVGPTLYVDALSKGGGPADTYEKMFRHNVPALVAAMAAN